MKTKYTMIAALLACAGTATAQEVDDMYFNATDRATHREANEAVMAVRYAADDKQAVRSQPVNPSDTYTGRGINPEYNAQQKSGAEIIQGNPDYFLAGYAPKDINSNLYTGSARTGSGCACSSYGGFGNPYGSFYSPYGYSPYSSLGYGGMYSPYGMGYGSGWSLSMMYGMGSMYGSPYYGMNPYGYYGYGSGYGYPYGYAYAASPVYGYDPLQTTYGRRAVRSGGSTPSLTYANPGAAGGTNGRTRTAGQGRTDYYDPTWRNDPTNFPSRSYGYSGRTSSYDPASTGRSSWGLSDGGSRTRTYDSFGGAGSRSMGGISGGTSSGGRSRGRN